MSYSVIGIITIVINIIINIDVLRQKNSDSKGCAKGAYRALIYGILVYLLTDTLWGICSATGNGTLLYINTIIYFITMYCAVFLWTRYVVIYLDNHETFSKVLVIVGNVLLFVELVALFINHFVHFFFWVDESGKYQAYIFRYIALFIQILLFLVTSVYVFVKQKKISKASLKKRYMAIGVFGITMSTAMVVQMLYPLLPIYSLGYMLGTCILHTFVIEDENDELRRIADESNEAKTRFLFNISHDIRTPMNAIMGFNSVAMKHIDNKGKALEALSKSRQAGNMLISLIDSVLELSRIESGKIQLEEQYGDVYYSFANLETTMRELAATKDINITFEFGSIKDRYVYCDFGRCLSILVNVISNSIKYTKAGGNVRVRCEQTKEAEKGYGTYTYTISDNGIGMSDEFQKHVFEQFARENTSTISGIQGTGLGMSVCKSLVDLMGGTIELTSKQGEGTTFKINLPLKIQESEKYTDPKTGEVVTSKTGTVESMQYDFTGKKILLVEDNEFNREIASEVLKDEGIIVEEATDGIKAVEIMKQVGPDYYDCILMDIQMPVMNGNEAAKAIRALFPDKHVPIIAVSANAFEEDKVAAQNAGMDGYVAKPIDVDELFKILSQLLITD